MTSAQRLTSLVAVVLIASASTVLATETVSPGALDRLASVEQRCPTFSWGAETGAAAYELIGYALPEDASQQVKLTAETEVMFARVAGSATSWTPSADRCFAPGGQYVWFARSVTELIGDQVIEAGEWSAPRYFEVPAGPTSDELARALDVLKRWEAANGGGSPSLFAAAHAAAAPVAAADAGPVAAAASGAGAGAGAGGGAGHPKSVPTASAAIRGAHPATSGEAYGIVGTAMSLEGAGIAAAHLDGGADLVLDGSVDGTADTLLSEWGINRAAATDQSFTMYNSGAGRLHLDVVGDISGHTIDVEEMKINGSTVIDDVGEWHGAGDMLPCPGCVDSSDIADGGVDTADLADGAVTEVKLAAGAVGSTSLGPGSVQSSHIAAEAVTSDKIEAGGVTTANIDASAVTSVKIADGTIGTADLADEAVTGTKIESRGVRTANIDFGAVTSAEIFDGTIAADDLADGAVTGAKLADGAVGSNVLRSNAVTNVHLADDAVTTAEILDGTVAGADIADGAIDYRKLTTGAVRSAQILDGAVGSQDLADGAVTTSKIGDFSITGTKIGPSMITGTHIAENAVNVSEIMAGAVISSKIADNAVVSTKIADGAIISDDVSPTGGIFSSGASMYAVSNESWISPGDPTDVSVACSDANDLPFQGGCSVLSEPDNLILVASYPANWTISAFPGEYHCVFDRSATPASSVRATIYCIEVD